MLTRPGSEPGPAWMRWLVDGSDPRRLRRMILRIVIILGLIQMTTVIIDIAVNRLGGPHVRSYNSPIQIAGMPLVSLGGRAHGIIAYGGVATGIIAVGGLSAGVIAFGGLSVGIFGFGGLTLAGIAVAPVAIGWRAIGAVAIGQAAAGALAIGRYAYAGPGVALGSRRGQRQSKRKSLWMNRVSEENSVRALLKSGIAQLRDAEVPSFTLAAELLLLHVLGRDRTWIYSHPEEELSALDSERYFALIHRRANGEPTQHLTGKQEFWGLEFEVTQDVLIPRPETEHIVEVALDRLAGRELRAGRRQKTDGSGLQIADIGTGSGCIAVALAKELPAAAFVATDISFAALAVAQRNAVRHGVANRIHFIECSLLRGLADSPLGTGLPRASKGQSPLLFDLVVSNPPYIGRREAGTLMREVREHEPEIALYGGEEGYELYADLIAQAATYLKPDGILVLELADNSLPAVQPLLVPSTWVNIGVTNDLAGIPRVLAAERL